MNVYVETNFVLELAFLQEQRSACRSLLDRAAAGSISLLIPAYSLVEPFETIHRRHRRQNEVQRRLEAELDQLSRTSEYSDRALELRVKASQLLSISRSNEEHRLDAICRELVEHGHVLPLTPEILIAAAEWASSCGMSRQDAIVLASVLAHRESVSQDASLFLNRNSKDFQTQEILEALESSHCKLLVSFEDGAAYLDARLAR